MVNMVTPIVQELNAKGEQIEAVISRIEPTLDGVPRGHAIMALLALAVYMQNPTIGPEQLVRCIKSVSEYICLLMETFDVENGVVAPQQAN